MQTHPDSDFASSLSDELGSSELEESKKELAAKAEKMMESGASAITAGTPEEKAIAEKQVGTILLRRMPDDPHCLRISIGEGHLIADSAYFVFRGDPEEIRNLLARALAALEVSGYQV